jgi:hypothetical protein
MCRLSVSSQRTDATVTHYYVDASRQPVPLPASLNVWDTVFPLDPETPVLWLDGDDWLHNPYVIDQIANIYEDPNVWLTYGSYITSDGKPGCAAPYKPGETIRTTPWRASHLKTFRAGLLQHIKSEDLLLPNGAWTHLCVELAYMFPMVEMAGWDRTRYIPDLLYIYNYSNSYEKNATPKEREDERAAVEFFRSKKPYNRLDSFI